jgi:hypothetical protein
MRRPVLLRYYRGLAGLTWRWAMGISYVVLVIMAWHSGIAILPFEDV